MSSPTNPPADQVPPTPADPAGRPGIAGPLLVFTVLRLGLIVVLTAILYFCTLPLIIALTIAIILQLPLSLLLFGGPRARLTAALAARNAGRRQERERLRAELRGDSR